LKVKFLKAKRFKFWSDFAASAASSIASSAWSGGGSDSNIMVLEILQNQELV
jgi:hypothetical protein